MDIDQALKTLSLGPYATTKDIKQAYRDLAKVWHPDRFPNDSRLQKRAEEKLKEINEAYETLQGYSPAEKPVAKDLNKGIGISSARSFRKYVVPFINVAVIIIILMITIIIHETSRLSSNDNFVPPLAQPLNSAPGEGVDPVSGEKFYLLHGIRYPIRSFNPALRDSSGIPNQYSGRQLSELYPGRVPAYDITVARETMRREPLDRFTIGSTKKAVLEVQGSPDGVRSARLPGEQEAWEYGSSEVFFKDGSVTGWVIGPGSPLKTLP